MGELFKRYYQRLWKNKVSYAITFLSIVAAVFLVLSVYSAQNAAYNKSLNLDDPEVNPQNYVHVSKAFFAGFALYSNAKDAGGQPIFEGYKYQTSDETLPMLKKMAIYFNGADPRNELIKLAGLEGKITYRDFDIQISDYSSMCYRFNVYSQNEEYCRALATVLDENLSQLLDRDLQITYVRTLGNFSVATEQPAPRNYLARVNDPLSQKLAAKADGNSPVTMQKTVYSRTNCAAAALGAGVLFLLALLILSEYFSNKIYKPEQIQKLSCRPYLASIPARHGEKAYTALAKTIRSSDRFGACIAVTGCTAKNNISPAVTGLAAALAAEGSKVLLLCLARESKSMLKTLSLKQEHGISDALGGTIEIQTAGDNLGVVPSGSAPEKLPDACDSEAFKAFLSKARESYDYVLFYGTDTAQNPQMLSVLGDVDAALVVVEYNAVSKSELRVTLERLDLLGVPEQASMLLNLI